MTTIGDYALSNTGCTEFIVPSNVTKIGFATFGHSKKLETFTFNASMKELPAAMCYECKSLKTVRICEGVEGYFGDIYSPFRFCESLQNVLLPQSLKNVGTSMFEGCSALEEINLPNNVTNIDSYAFWNCTSLKNVNCPEKLETIRRMGFRNTAIEEFTCSNTIKTIGEGAFTECKKLKSISLGVSIQRIDGTAFANCPNLENVYCRAEKVPNTNASAFDNSYPNYCNLYVPQASVGLYSTTSPWSSFGTIASIEDIEPPVCATPTITIENGRLSFACETPGAECHYTVAPASSTTEGTGMTNILIPFAEVRVYAVAPGYAKSETATKVLTITDLLSSATPGDVNGDTQVTISDVTKLVDILLEKKD